MLIWQTLPQRQESLGSETLAGVDKQTIAAYLDEQGVDPYELADSEQIHSLLGNDTTAIQYLNVHPDEIQQMLDEQNIQESLNRGS